MSHCVSLCTCRKLSISKRQKATSAIRRRNDSNSLLSKRAGKKMQKSRFSLSEAHGCRHMSTHFSVLLQNCNMCITFCIRERRISHVFFTKKRRFSKGRTSLQFFISGAQKSSLFSFYFANFEIPAKSGPLKSGIPRRGQEIVEKGHYFVNTIQRQSRS